jgi:hypothetical protein
LEEFSKEWVVLLVAFQNYTLVAFENCTLGLFT